MTAFEALCSSFFLVAYPQQGGEERNSHTKIFSEKKSLQISKAKE